jgi:hypothetical protein
VCVCVMRIHATRKYLTSRFRRIYSVVVIWMLEMELLTIRFRRIYFLLKLKLPVPVYCASIWPGKLGKGRHGWLAIFSRS